MPTDPGYAHILARAMDAPSRVALRRVWASLGKDYRTPEMVTLFKRLAKGLPET